jgi:hypothetical protein
LRDAGLAVREVVKDTDGESAKAGEVRGTVAGSDAAPVLVEVPVDDIVATVFDGPVAAVDFDKTFWPGLFGRATRDPECGFERSLPAFLVDDLALNQEDLANVREIDIGI